MKDIAHEQTDKALAKLEKEINTIYAQAKNELQEELDKSNNWNEILNMRDSKKRLAAVRKKNKLNKLIKEISFIIVSKNKISLDLLNNDLINTFTNNYNWGGYFLEHLTGFNLDFSLYSREAVAELLKETTPVFTKMAYLGSKDIKKIRSDLRRQLTVGILKGDSITEIADKIDNVTNKNNHGSIRIARTETTRIENSGRLQAFKRGEDKGLKLKKQWISTIDGRTRVSHRHLQGEVVEMDKKFSNGLLYPGDPEGRGEEVVMCRCTHIVEFEGVEEGAKELELDEELKNMSYEEWEEEHVE